jgi:chromosome segregation ATPase
LLQQIEELQRQQQVLKLQSENEALRLTGLQLHAKEQELTKKLEKYSTKNNRQTDMIADLTTARQDNEDFKIKAEADSLLIHDLQSEADTLKQNLLELKSTEQGLTEELHKLQNEYETLRRTDLQLRAAEQELTKKLEKYRTKISKQVEIIAGLTTQRRKTTKTRLNSGEERRLMRTWPYRRNIRL